MFVTQSLLMVEAQEVEGSRSARGWSLCDDRRAGVLISGDSSRPASLRTAAGASHSRYGLPKLVTMMQLVVKKCSSQT